MSDNSEILLTQITSNNTQTVSITDLLCEGPIEGLVNGEGSIYLDNAPLMEGESLGVDGGQSTVTFVAGVGTFSEDVLSNNFDLGTITGQRTILVKSAVLDTVVLTWNSQGYFDVTELGGGSIVGLQDTRNDSTIYAEFSAPGYTWVGELEQVSATAGKLWLSTPITWAPEFPTGNIFSYRIINKLDIESVVLTPGAQTVTVTDNTFASTNSVFTINSLNLPSINETSEGAVRRLESSQSQFRTGEFIQEPISVTGDGTPSTSVDITGGISGPTELLQVDPSILATYGLATSDFPSVIDFTTDKYEAGEVQANSATIISTVGQGGAAKPAADELRFTISYSTLANYSERSGQIRNVGIFYAIMVRKKAPGSLSFSDWQNAKPSQKYIAHTGKTPSPTAFEQIIDLKPLQPFDDVEVAILRLTRAGGSVGVSFNGSNHGSAKGTVNAGISNAFLYFYERLEYPYTSVAQVEFSSKDLSQIPKRTYEIRGLKILVPDNYTTREETGGPSPTYSGNWTGTFRNSKVYCDNPAWIMYDIVTNNRYGAGEYLGDSLLDKFSLYRIAKYCDELVESGQQFDATNIQSGLAYKITSVGTTDFTLIGASANTVGEVFTATGTGTGTGEVTLMEPRFRANIYLSKSTDVFKVLKDLATTFTGLLYFLDGQLTPVLDGPSDSVMNFSKSNVLDGLFEYQTTGSKTKVNQIIVSWNNPNNNYELTPVIVEDREDIARSGRLVKQSAVAFGATSEAQAIRYGRWKLFTAQFQRELVTFRTSLTAGFLQPGDVINVFDSGRVGRSFAGRVKSAVDVGGTQTTITFDRAVNFIGASNYTLNLLITKPAAFLQEESYDVYSRGDLIPTITTEQEANDYPASVVWKEHSYVQSIDLGSIGTNQTSVTINDSLIEFDGTKTEYLNFLASSVYVIKEEDVDGLDTSDSAKKFRILSIAEEDTNIYGITAVEYKEEKWDAIEKDYSLAFAPTSDFTPETVDVPSVSNLFVFPRSNFNKPGEELELQWIAPVDDQDNPYGLVDQYEIAHNVDGEPSPILVDASTTSYKFSQVPDDNYTFRVRVKTTKGNLSRWESENITVDDPFNQNCPRGPMGLPLGITSNSRFVLTQDTLQNPTEAKIVAENTAWGIASFGNPFEVVVNQTPGEINNSEQRVSRLEELNIPLGDSNTYVIFDADATSDHLKFIRYRVDNTFANGNVQYWYNLDEVTAGGDESGIWTSVPNATISQGNNIVSIASGVQRNDVLRIDEGGAVYHGFRVLDVEGTQVVLDRAPDISGSLSTERLNLRLDLENDAAVARVYRESATTYAFKDYVIVDPNIEGLRGVELTFSPNPITYDTTDGINYTLVTNISGGIDFVAEARGYSDPRFAFSGTGFLNEFGYTLQPSDGDFSIGPDIVGGNKATFTVGSPTDPDYNAGQPDGSFVVSVREAQTVADDISETLDDNDLVKLANGQIGSDGLSGKTAILESEDYSVIYDEKGANPQYSDGGTIGQLDLTATPNNFTTPEYKFTVLSTSGTIGDFILTPSGTLVDNGFYTGATATVTVPTNHSSWNADKKQGVVTIKVEIRDDGGAVEASDTTIINGIHTLTDGYWFSISNSAHTVPADNAGVPTSNANSGTTIEVGRGGVVLDFITGAFTGDGIGQWRITDTDSTTGITPGSITDIGDLASVADHTFGGTWTVDSGFISYTIDVEDGQAALEAKQTFGKSKTGNDGAQGDAGAPGDDAKSNGTGYVYYQLSSASAPAAPTATSYNIETSTFTGLTANWSISPPTFQAGNTNKYWYATYAAISDANGGFVASGANLNFGSVVQGIGFTGLVTFTSNTASLVEVDDGLGNTLSFGSSGTTQIDGGRITTGTVIADRISITGKNISDLTNDLGLIDASGAPVQSVAGKTGVVTVTKGDVNLGVVENFDPSGQLQQSFVDATLLTAGNIFLGSTTGNRIEISAASNTIEIYEGTTLRVKLGNLA